MFRVRFSSAGILAAFLLVGDLDHGSGSQSVSAASSSGDQNHRTTHGHCATRQGVDMMELNHFIDDQGREVFQQVIFYDWDRTDQCFHVRAWRLIKKPTQLPRRLWKPSGYICVWRDNHVTREVWAPSLRETWTQRDPERVNRSVLPENQRRPLWHKR